MCERSPIPEAVQLVADLHAALLARDGLVDVVAIAERVAARIAETHASWRPRAWSQRLSDSTIARVYLGGGLDSFLYVTPEGRVRVSGAVPVRWRRELFAILDAELGLLEVVRGRGGLVAKKAG